MRTGGGGGRGGLEAIVKLLGALHRAAKDCEDRPWRRALFPRRGPEENSPRGRDTCGNAAATATVSDYLTQTCPEYRIGWTSHKPPGCPEGGKGKGIF